VLRIASPVPDPPCMRLARRSIPAHEPEGQR
jgi:hypothetical protein